MITKTVFLASLDTGAFLLGYAGENEHIKYDIRCDSIFSDYPDATVSMLIKSPDGTVYPKVLTIDKPSVYWVVTASDTANDGNGQVQITFTNGDEVIKTVVASTVTMPSLFVSGEEPDPIATWIDDANEVLGQVQSALEEIPAEIQTEVAAQMSSTVDDWLEENISNPSSPPLDRSLTLANAAAPADLVGTKADAIYDTVTDQAIATVSDGANGMVVKELDVAVSPVQDLHGQSNPYPAGGGKNILPLTVEKMKASNTGGTWSGNVFSYLGLTYTILVDESNNVTGIDIHGTATTTAVFFFDRTFTITGSGEYIFSGVTGGASSTYRFECYWRDDNNASKGSVAFYNNGETIKVSDKTGATKIDTFIVAVIGGATVNHVKIYPMVRLSSVSDATFAPYSNICPITGWTGANVTRTGVNLFSSAKETQRTVYRATVRPISNTVNGYYLTGANGATDTTTLDVSTWAYISIDYGFIFKEQTSVAFSCKVHNYTDLGGANGFVRLITADANSTTGTTALQMQFSSVGVTNLSGTATIPAGKKLIISYSPVSASTAKTLTQATEVYDIQLEFGTAATTYEPYAGQTYAISFPGTAGTVYGGTLNATTGVLTVDKAVETLNKNNIQWTDARGGRFSCTLTNTYLDYTHECICNFAKYNISPIGSTLVDNTVAINTSVCYFLEQNYTTTTDFLNAVTGIDLQVGGYLATPVTYSLTAAQVTTLLGINNVWADCGNVSMTYPADTKLYINKVIAAAVAAL